MLQVDAGGVIIMRDLKESEPQDLIEPLPGKNFFQNVCSFTMNFCTSYFHNNCVTDVHKLYFFSTFYIFFSRDGLLFSLLEV